MALEISVLQKADLMYMRATGDISDDDSLAAFETYATHPHARAGQNMLADLSGLQNAHIDYSKRMSLHAIMEPILTLGPKKRTYVIYAPTERSLTLGRNFLRFWQAVPQIDTHLCTSERETLRILNLQYSSLSAMLAAED